MYIGCVKVIPTSVEMGQLQPDQAALDDAVIENWVRYNLYPSQSSRLLF